MRIKIYKVALVAALIVLENGVCFAGDRTSELYAGPLSVAAKIVAGSKEAPAEEKPSPALKPYERTKTKENRSSTVNGENPLSRSN